MHKTLHIERLCYGADAIAHDENGRTVFVTGGVPGETVPVTLTEERATFARGIVAGEALEASPHRVAPVCAACGGCAWGAVAYEAQLAAKTANLRDALVRTGHMDAARVERVVRACVPSPAAWGYRNKIELAAVRGADGRLELGMAQAGSHELARIDACPLANTIVAKTPKSLRGALRFLCGASDLGLFRVGVRGSVRTRDVEVALWTTPGPFPRAQAAKVLRDALPQVTSVVRVVAERGKARAVKQVEALWGKGCWEEQLCGERFFTSAPSFFQVNTPQAEVLVQTALGFLANGASGEGGEGGAGAGAGGDGAGTGGGVGGASDEGGAGAGKSIPSPLAGAFIADLYAGGGTFSIPLARAGADVVAVESAGTSVRDLRRNAERAGVHVDVVGGDAARELPELGELDALVVDPPRAGLASGVPASIAEAAPERVVYVSCDPATLARDIAVFETLGYELTAAQPVDLFPQTFHAETVALLTRTRR